MRGAVSGERETPVRGVQLVDRRQWYAIVAAALLALVALGLALAALRHPTAQPLAPPALHLPACPAAPACPACAACAPVLACPTPAPREHHHR